MKTRLTLLVLCVALTVLSGVLRGVVDQRWGAAEGMLEAAARVESLPKQIGEWKSVHEGELEPEAAKMLRCEGSVVRNYMNEETGETVSVVLLVGPAGPLAVHTPEVCYSSSNFTIVERTHQIEVRDVQGNEQPFSKVTFSENHVSQRLQRVYYAWNHQGKWMAPANPRRAFAGIPMLYKVQIATNALGKNEEMDAAEKFLMASLPDLKEICR